MTNRRIVYTRPDGGLSIVVPAPEFVAEFRGERDAMAAILAKDVPPDATDVVECAAADIPVSRTFREAWERDTSPSPQPVMVNMNKARGVHMARIRAVRDEMLQRLDGEWMRATSKGDHDEVTRIDAEKQSLRDIPQTFDITDAATPDELAATWPTLLREKTPG